MTTRKLATTLALTGITLLGATAYASPAQAATNSKNAVDGKSMESLAGVKLWAPDSPVYQKLPKNAPVDANSNAIVSKAWGWMKQRNSIWWPSLNLNTSTSYTNALIVSHNSDPVFDVKVPDSPHKEQYLRGVHIPSNIKSADGLDGQLSVYNADSKRYIDLWGASYFNGVWTAKSGGSITDATESNTQFPNALQGAYTSASALALEPYTIKVHELKAGVINHPIALQIPGSFENGTPSWPAQATDSWAAGIPITNTNLSLGQRMRLAPTVNVDSLNLSPVAKTIAKAAQSYGVIVTDSTSHPSDERWANFSFATESPINLVVNPYPSLLGGVADWDLLTGEGGKCDWFPFDKMQVLQRSYKVPSTVNTPPVTPTPALVKLSSYRNSSSFGVEASSIPAGGRMTIVWKMGGQWQETSTSSKKWYSGTQEGWSDAKAVVTDGNGKIVASIVINRPSRVVASHKVGSHKRKQVVRG